DFMKQINPKLQQFARSSTLNELRTGKNCVIYTRVSSKEQAENNSSLASQKRYCEEYAQKKGYSIKDYFGGTFESAKGDERKEFKRLIDYVKRTKAIEAIIV